MAKEKDQFEEIDRLLDEPIEPPKQEWFDVVFRVYALELWFWRIAVPIALIISIYNLLK